MRSFRLLTPCLFILLLAACQGGNLLTGSTPTTAVLPIVASVTPSQTPQPTPTQTPTPLPQYPFDPGPTPVFDQASDQWLVTDQQGQKWMLDAAINTWGKAGEAVVSDGELLVWDESLRRFMATGLKADSGEKVTLSGGETALAVLKEVSG